MIRILNEQKYTRLLDSFFDYHFIQSSEHNYQMIMYGNCEYISFESNNKVLALFKFAITRGLKNKKIALGSFGPIINFEKITPTLFSQFIKELTEYIQKKDVIFLQIYPAYLNEDENKKIDNLLNQEKFLKQSFKKYTWLDGTMVVDLNQDIDDMFRSFRKDVKYNTKKAQKYQDHKIEIIKNLKKSDIDNFMDLYEKQQERVGFYDRAKDFYLDLFDKKKAILFLAKDKEEIVSAIMGVDFEKEKTLITYISASIGKAFKLKSPTLLRWELIKWAKNNGYEKVDFFSLDKNTPSVNNFKRGFRPKEILYPENAYDLVIKPKLYYFYKIYKQSESLFLRKH